MDPERGGTSGIQDEFKFVEDFQNTQIKALFIKLYR